MPVSDLQEPSHSGPLGSVRIAAQPGVLRSPTRPPRAALANRPAVVAGRADRLLAATGHLLELRARLVDREPSRLRTAGPPESTIPAPVRHWAREWGGEDV